MARKEYTQEDLDRILDELKQGPLGHRSQAKWNLIENLEVANSVNRGRSKSEKTKRKMSESSPNRGTGRLYKELSTGFIGFAWEQKQRFGINDSYFKLEYLGKTKAKGKHEGRCWVEVASQD
jgi:hypothetical protein